VEMTGYQSCVLLENAAETAFAVYKFDQAEQLALKSLQSKLKDCPASAYPHLANLYLLRADFQRAMAAVKSGRDKAFNVGIDSNSRWYTAWLARLLYALGQFKKSYELTEQVVRAPIEWNDQFLLELCTSSRRWIITRPSKPIWRASGTSLSTVLRKAAYILDCPSRSRTYGLGCRHRSSRLLARHDTLVHLVRPYFKPLPPWQTGALIAVTGAALCIRRYKKRGAMKP